MKRIITGSIVSAAFCIIAYLVFVYVQGYILYDGYETQPKGKVKLDTWINEFYENALTLIVIAFAGVIVWYVFSYLYYRITSWKQAPSFLPWLLIFVILIVGVCIYGYKYTQPTEDQGIYIACFCYALNAAFIYWLSTAIFSPSSVKYVPLGSIRLRMAALGNFIVKKLG